MIRIGFKSAVSNLYSQRFAYFQMVLRKTTIDNSVRNIPKTEKTRERDFKRNKMKNNSTPRKQNKNLSQNNKKFLKIISAQGFEYLSG